MRIQGLRCYHGRDGFVTHAIRPCFHHASLGKRRFCNSPHSSLLNLSCRSWLLKQLTLSQGLSNSTAKPPDPSGCHFTCSALEQREGSASEGKILKMALLQPIPYPKPPFFVVVLFALNMQRRFQRWCRTVARLHVAAARCQTHASEQAEEGFEHGSYSNSWLCLSPVSLFSGNEIGNCHAVTEMAPLALCGGRGYFCGRLLPRRPLRDCLIPEAEMQ